MTDFPITNNTYSNSSDAIYDYSTVVGSEVYIASTQGSQLKLDDTNVSLSTEWELNYTRFENYSSSPEILVTVEPELGCKIEYEFESNQTLLFINESMNIIDGIYYDFI